MLGDRLGGRGVSVGGFALFVLASIGCGIANLGAGWLGNRFGLRGPMAAGLGDLSDFRASCTGTGNQGRGFCP